MKKIFLIFVSLIFIATNAFAANEWRSGSTAATIPGNTLINDIDVVSYQNIVDPLDRTLSTFNTIGLVYSSATAITASNGSVVCSDSGGTIRKMRLNPSTTSVSFTDIDTGAEASATTYYVWANCDADATTATFKISASSSAPSGVTYYAKIGSFYNNSSSDIDRTKIYAEPYGNPTTDASGIQMLQAIYDYGTSASSFTSKTGGLLVAFGSQSVGADSTASISNLPFTSSSTYSCSADYEDNTTNDDGYAGCAPSSGSALTLINQQGAGARTIRWMAFGY